ncbi:hypothetical protein NQ315_016770 [Exocentrus adspersus]|uniref:Uncharacterized protein n=1 Tax=Exocentrus adspersus TaxID=1586481 RepID=A0AAV8V6C2_9CUCU|nr:hypothetical protein NQ315_016770 [Exocentrus adspersus]
MSTVQYYLKFGFLHQRQIKDCPYAFYATVLSNDSMKPSKLEDHLKRCHPDKIDKDLKYFQTLKEKYEKSPTVHSMFASTSQSNDDGLRASYNISLLIAKSGKPHTIGEQLILPAIEENYTRSNCNSLCHPPTIPGSEKFE